MTRKVKDYLLLFILSFIWGSSFILMKKGLESYSSIELAALRLFVAFVFLSPFLLISFKNMKIKYIVPLLITGFIGNGIPAVLFAKSQMSLPSSFVGILNSLTPIFTLILASLIFGEKSSKKNILGIVIGFSGALLLYFSRENVVAFLNIDVLLVVLATFLYAVSINVVRNYLWELDALSISSISLFFVGPFAGYYVFKSNIFEVASTATGFISLIYICVLGILGTSLAVVLFNKLIKDTTAIFASSVTYLIPIVALAWGFLVKEEIGISHFLGIIIILLGVYLVNK